MQFFLKCLFSTMCAKNFQIYGGHIPEKCIDSRRFYSCPPHSKLSPKILSSCPIGRRKLLLPKGSVLSKICFSHKQKRVEKISICFIKIPSENTKITRNIRFFIFCMICNFFKCDGFTVLQITSIIQYYNNFNASLMQP